MLCEMEIGIARTLGIPKKVDAQMTNDQRDTSHIPRNDPLSVRNVRVWPARFMMTDIYLFVNKD